MLHSIAQNAQLLLLGIAVALLVVFRDPFFVFHIVASFVVGVGGNALLKGFFRRVLSPDSYLARRPDPTAVCGVGDTVIDSSSVHAFGFPSGHVQAVATSVVMYIWWIVQKKNLSSLSKVFVSALSVFFVIFVAYSRMHKGCHNIEQVSAGALAGLLGGLLSVKLWLEMQ